MTTSEQTDARITPTDAQLEQEGDAAADYLEGLLDIADIDGDLALDVRGGRAYVSVETEAAGSLGRLADPDTVQALQELTRLAVQSTTGRFSRLILDIAGSRDARQRELEVLVDRAIERLEEGASQASLPAMSSYERKLIHDIAADRGFSSESFGEGAERHPVIRRA
ncbi:protein jag [Microbacterium sp. P04]|uniref:Jag family protein n=1 Tax=Microbacterium sp. P04 TaxID=3366947 RepID=UPI003746458C